MTVCKQNVADKENTVDKQIAVCKQNVVDKENIVDKQIMVYKQSDVDKQKKMQVNRILSIKSCTKNT